MMYAVSVHQMLHLPEVWDDAFDITYWATAVCKAQTSGARPITSILHAGVDITKAFGLDWEIPMQKGYRTGFAISLVQV